MNPLAGLGLDQLKLPLAWAHGGWFSVVKTGAEIVIIAYAAIWLWARIKGSQAERLVKGVMVLVFVCVFSYLAGFTLITAILQQVIPVFVLALLIVFQPEIRRGLGYLGRGKGFRMDLSLADSEKERTRISIEQVIGAVRELARNKVGALIVVEPLEGERDYLSPGTTVNADVSSTLLLSIFMPSSPLHDGAVVIRQNKIVAAGVILPMTDNPKLSYRYGTRHRAAIGLSEVYDGLCIVVSEETGHISAASRGMLVRYESANELADPLMYLYDDSADEISTPLQLFLNLFSWARKGREGATPAAAAAPPAVPAEAEEPESVRAGIPGREPRQEPLSEGVKPVPANPDSEDDGEENDLTSLPPGDGSGVEPAQEGAASS